MKKYLFKVKTLCTLYLDAYENEWGDENPRDWGRTCEETLRKGSVLYVEGYDLYDNCEYVILYTKNRKGGIILNDIIEVETLKDWFEVIENDK